MHVCIDWTYWSIELMSRPETANHVLAGFFPGPRGPLKESSIPHPSFLPPVHHSSAIFILQDTLLIFKIQSKYFHFANISSPPQKKFPLQIFFLSVFSPAQKNICLLQMFSFFPSPFFFSYAEQQLFPFVQVFSFFSLSIISTGGALRRPMTYDKQSHPIHRSI